MIKILQSLEEQKPQRGLELKQLARWYITICLEEQKPQRGLKHISDSSSAFQARLEEQKPQRGLKRTARIVFASTIRSLEEQKPQRGLKHLHLHIYYFLELVWKNRNPKGD